MNTASHLSQDDLALFALQLLPEDETATALEHLQHCEACRKEVGEFQGDLVLYSMLSEMHTPPALARERLLRRVAKEKRVIPVEKPAEAAISAPAAEPVFTGRRGGVLEMEPRYTASARSRFIAVIGWALAACLAVAAGLFFHQRQQLQNQLNSERAGVSSVQETASSAQAALSALTDPAALNVTLRQPTARGAEAPQVPEAHAAYLPDRGALVFVATNLEPLQPYKVYELWLLSTLR